MSGGRARAKSRPTDWTDEEFATDPFPFWDLCRDEFPVWRDERLGYWLITRYDDVVAVFEDSETWSNKMYANSLGVVFGPTMLQMDGRDHVVRRTIIAPEVVGKRLEGYRELITRNAHELIDRIEARGTRAFDLVGDFSTRLPVNVILDMMDLPKDDHERFHEWYQSMMAGLSNYNPEARRKGVESARAFIEYCEPFVAERTAHPGDDFVSKIIHADCDGERLSQAEIQAFMCLLLVAGGETTDKAIANLWANVLSDGEQLGLCVDDHANLDAAFGEMMRHSFPVIAQSRLATVDIELHGETIEAGQQVSISIGSANNDERVFADPRRFDLRRADLWKAKELRKGYDRDGMHGHLGFGLGKHFCLGYEMARLESVLGSELLLERLGPDLRLADGADTSMRIRGATRSVSSLPVNY